MKLGLVIYGSLDTLSGGYLYDRKLVEGWQRQGDSVEIVSLPCQDYPRHLLSAFSPALYKRLAGMQVDVLLQDELNHPSLFWAVRRLQRSAPFPMVSIVHHLRSSERRPAWQNRFYAWIERSYLSHVDAFITNSRTTQAAVQACLGAAARPSLVAYPSGARFQSQVTPQEVQLRARQPGALRLVSVGNVIPRKGLHTLLAALALLKDSHPSLPIQLDIVGSRDSDPEYAALLVRLVKAGGLRGQVRFMNILTDAALEERLRQAHALVVPSTYEGFGIVYLEGMGFGLPAVGTHAGAAGEVITDGLDGFLVPPEAPAALAGCLAALAGDRERLAEMSLAALRRYAAHPTWEETAALSRRFLQSLCEGFRR